MFKTPVSLLHKLGLKRCLKPKFDFVRIEGTRHPCLGALVALGCGQSKKQAKHKAAESMLESIRTREEPKAAAAAKRPYQSAIATEVKKPVVKEVTVQHPEGEGTTRRDEEEEERRKWKYDEILGEVTRVHGELDDLRREKEELEREKAELQLESERLLRRQHEDV